LTIQNRIRPFDCSERRRELNRNVRGGTVFLPYRATEQLQAVAPVDQRMRGLAWAWEGDQLVLVTEPNPPPTGSSYVGARMRPVESSGRD